MVQPSTYIILWKTPSPSDPQRTILLQQNEYLLNLILGVDLK